MDRSSLKSFSIKFSWDFPDNWCLKDVQDAIFHILDANNKSVHDPETVINMIQCSGPGIILTRPNAETDTTTIPCELHLQVHQDFTQFHIIKILVISEAKHIELYLDDMYDVTSKGRLSNMKKGTRGATYESQLELSAPVQEPQKVSLKFLSLADKESIRIQAIVLTTIKREKPALPKKSFSSADVHSVRDMIKSMNIEVVDNAQKLMKDIESHQQSQNQLLFQKLLLTQNGNINSTQLDQITRSVHPPQVETKENLTPQLGMNQNLLPTQLAQLQNLISQSGVNTLSNMGVVPNEVSEAKCNCQHEYMEEVNNKCKQTLQQQQMAVSKPCNNAYEKTFNDAIKTGFRDHSYLPQGRAHIQNHSQQQNGACSHTTRTDSDLLLKCNGGTETHNGFHNGDDYNCEVATTKKGDGRCKECGCTGCHQILSDISKSLTLMENNLKSHIDVKIEELRHHLDKRLDGMNR